MPCHARGRPGAGLPPTGAGQGPGLSDGPALGSAAQRPGEWVNGQREDGPESVR